MAGARAHEADRKHPAGSPDDDQYSQPGEKADTEAADVSPRSHIKNDELVEQASAVRTGAASIAAHTYPQNSGQTDMPDAGTPYHQLSHSGPAAHVALQNVEIGIPADSQVAKACGYMTRAKHSLAHITLDELEQTLPLPPEKLLPLEDGEEYQFFLHALQNDLEELPEEDEEDNDFTLDGLDELLGPMESDAEDIPSAPEPPRPAAQGKAAAKRARRYTSNQDQQRRLPMLLPETPLPNEVLGVPACHIITQGQDDTSPSSPPILPGDLWSRDPDYSPRGFDAAQLRQLYLQLNHHCQLMIEVFALTACNSSYQETATQLGNLLCEYQEHSKSLLEQGPGGFPGKQDYPPYPPELLGLAPKPDSNSPDQIAAAGSPTSVIVSRQIMAPSASPRDFTGVDQRLAEADSLLDQPGAADICGAALQKQASAEEAGSDSNGTGSTISQAPLPLADAESAAPIGIQACPPSQAADSSHGPVQMQIDSAAQAPEQQQQAVGSHQPASCNGSPQQQAAGSHQPASCNGSPQQQAAGSHQPASCNGSPQQQEATEGTGQSRVAVWQPVADFPVHSITEVTCMKLLPECLADLSKVAIVAQNGQPDVEQGSNGAAAKRLTSNSSSRRPPPPTVPAEVKQAVAIFKPCFDPIFFPRFQALPLQMSWTQGEDELVAAGILRYGIDFDLISRHMLPVRTCKEIQTRQKNRCHRVGGNCIRTAKEHVTRPLEAEEVAVIAKAMSVLEHNWRLQRQLEEMHGLKDSTKDYRTQSTNRWRLLPYIHQLNLQSRAGLVLKQMYDQVTQNKPKTSHTGDPPGATRFKVPKARPEVQASFLTEPVGSQQEEPETKQHGGSRAIVLQPPIFLLFDDPALVQSLAEDHRMVAGRLAKIRRPVSPKVRRKTRKGIGDAALNTADRSVVQHGADASHDQQAVPYDPNMGPSAGSFLDVAQATQQMMASTSQAAADSAAAHSNDTGAGHTLEVADGIPAPFPLVAHHQPSPPFAARPAPRPPRQHSRANPPACKTFTACLLSEQPPENAAATHAQDPMQLDWQASDAPTPFAAEAEPSFQAEQAGLMGYTESQEALLGHDSSLQAGIPLPEDLHIAANAQQADTGHQPDLASAEVGTNQQQLVQFAGNPAQLDAPAYPALDDDPMEGPAPAHSDSPPETFAPEHSGEQYGLDEQADVEYTAAASKQTAVQHVVPPVEQDEQGQPALSQHQQPHQAVLPQQQQQQHEEMQPALYPQHWQQQRRAESGAHKASEHPQNSDLSLPAVEVIVAQASTSAPPVPAAVSVSARHPAQLPLLLPAQTSLPQDVPTQQMQESANAQVERVSPDGNRGGVDMFGAAAELRQPGPVLSPGQSIPTPSAHSPSLEQQGAQSGLVRQQQQQHQQIRPVSQGSPVLLTGQSSPVSVGAQQAGVQNLSHSLSPSAGAVHGGLQGADACSPEGHADEAYEQDVLSQPSSSDSDEDFAPSEFEQDEMSQPESSSEEDAFEVDEMSQPESSSEDEPELHREPVSTGDRLAAAVASRRAASATSGRPAAVTSGRSAGRSLRLSFAFAQLARLGFPRAAQAVLNEAGGPSKSPSPAKAAVRGHALPAGQNKAGSKRALSPHEALEARQADGKRARTSDALPAVAQGSSSHRQQSRLPTHEEQPTLGSSPVQAGRRATPVASPSKAIDTVLHRQQQQQPAPVSFRKRPRKPPRPQCSGPSVFCQPPSPDLSRDPTNGKASNDVPSPSRQLRPRQNVVGRWAAKGPRQQGSKAGQDTSPSNSPLQSNAASGQHTSARESEPPSDAQAQPIAAELLPDNMQLIDGVVTTWTDTADRSILLACLVTAQGRPSPEIFDSLVTEICESGCHVSLRQVQARFSWLLDRFLANRQHLTAH